MGTRILRGPVVKNRADRPDSTGAGHRLGGAGDIQELPAGVTRLGDPSVRATARGRPAAVAWPLAHRGRVTGLDGREKVYRDGLLRAAVAAVTRGQRFLDLPTIGGRVLWVGEAAAADVKGQLAAADANLDKIFFIRGPSPAPDHESSLPRLVARLCPVWVIIDPWRHYFQVQTVTAAAGPGAEKALLGDLVDRAREYNTAVTVSHDNENRPGAYTDSAVLGATDLLISVGPGKSPTTLRLQPSARSHLAPVDIGWRRDRGYLVVKGSGHPGRSRTDDRPLAERVVLLLHKLGADVRPPARDLGFHLACEGRRFGELSKALKRLCVEGIVDCAQRSGASNGRGRGYALTERGRGWAECLRQASDSGTSANRDPSAASTVVAGVSEGAFPAVGGSGNAAPPTRETSAASGSGTVSEGAFPAVGGSGNAAPPTRETSAASGSETVSEGAFPAVGGSVSGNATPPTRETSAATGSETLVPARCGVGAPAPGRR